MEGSAILNKSLKLGLKWQMRSKMGFSMLPHAVNHRTTNKLNNEHDFLK